MVKTTKLTKLRSNPLDIKLKKPSDLTKLLGRLISAFIRKEIDEKDYRALVYGLQVYSGIVKDHKPESTQQLNKIEIKFLNNVADIEEQENDADWKELPNNDEISLFYD